MKRLAGAKSVRLSTKARWSKNSILRSGSVWTISFQNRKHCAGPENWSSGGCCPWCIAPFSSALRASNDISSGRYDAETGGHFSAHRDNTAPVVAHRRFAVTINLNEGYEGGDLRFPEFGSQTCRASPGDAIVFSCSLLHEVTPVTRNRRYAFISFFYDERSQQMREAYMKSMAQNQTPTYV